ncbi:unnamed protein product [Toxocara canis]|uniref:Conserved oligomeric Golgi complex subunit 3 n=1 Tax=Toxocara canis TaxID=6265 RepID=A0A3P7GHP3_TOXCA|nr:unnamed protein product [Toxocara canis]
MQEATEEEVETIGASPDAYVSFLFTQPENSKDLPGGKLVKFLIGFHNRGEKDFIVRYCETSFRYPQDFSYHIQNFTLARYERVVAPKQEASFDYSFFPSDQFAGRPLGLVVELHYVDSEGALFASTLFNETVMIVEDESNFNTETGFLYVIFAAAVVLILLAGQHFLSKLTRKHGMTKNRQQSQAIETGTTNKNEVDFEWIPREVLNHSKFLPFLCCRSRSMRQWTNHQNRDRLDNGRLQVCCVDERVVARGVKKRVCAYKSMDTFEALHKRTVELLAANTANYALPAVENDESEEESEVEHLGEDGLYSFLSELHKNDAENTVGGMCDNSEQVKSLRACIRRMRALIERYNLCSQTMNELRTDYNFVTERTCSLHHACDQMMAHQTQIAAGAEQIHANLYYFTQYENIIKKLTSGKISITGQSFTQLLATIDECLTFLRAHMYYKDSALYVAKYEQCLSKAMTAIRSGVITDLQASAAAVAERQTQIGVQHTYSDDDTFALLYGVFAAKANSVRAALSVAEHRFANVPEFESMAADCHHAYFSIRQQLLTPIVQKTIQELLSRHSDSSCALTRNGCAFLLRLCDDEFRLYKQFFNVAGEEKSSPRSRSSSEPPSSLKTVLAPFIVSLTSFDDFIESFCRLFYDVLRPIIVHNPHLETLTELSTILKMIEERCGLMMSVLNPQSVVDPSSVSADFEGNMLNPRSGFVRVMRELVLDIAERIFYRAVLYAENEIANYQPSPGDLAYPEKLVMMNNIAKELSNKVGIFTRHFIKLASETATSTAVATCAVDLNCLWYPTVRRTVICLSKLYNCLYPGVFECLSRELVTACCDSLKTAADQIEKIIAEKNMRSQGLMHSQLFVVKHLLILREQTSPFRNSPPGGTWDGQALQRDYSLDLGKYKTSAAQLFHDREHWFDFNSKNAFLEFLFQVPISVSEQLGDFRRIIDARLKSHCHTLIENTANMIIIELADYMNKVEEASLGKGDVDIAKEPLLSAANMQNFVGQAYRKLTHCWPEILSAFNLYIGAKDTEDILLQPVKKRIVDIFARANVFASKLYDEEQKQIASVPLSEQIWLVLNAA